MKDGPAFRRRLAAAKQASVAHGLLRSGRLVNEEGVRRVREASGRGDLRPSHMGIFPHLDLDGTRIGELARRMEVSKQAVSQLVDDLERADMVTRRPDPDDARARRVELTDAGRRSMLEGLEVLRSIEEEALRALPSARREGFAQDLARVLDALEQMSRRAD